MFEDVERVNERVKKAEAIEIQRIERALNRRLVAIEREIRNNWSSISNTALLPDQKANAMFGSIERQTSIGDFSGNLRDLYTRVRDEGSGLNQRWLVDQVSQSQEGKSLNEPVDFWTLDGNNRIRDWYGRFIDKVRGSFRLGFQNRLGQQNILSAVRQSFGTLQSEVSRVVKTGSTGVIGQVSERFALANDLDLVVFKTTEDDRRCPFCAAREGNVYRRGDISVPIHPNCRCNLLPVSAAMLRDENFRKSLRAANAEAKAVLEQAGGSPNFGVAPFEKNPAIKNQKPPRPVFLGSRGFNRNERRRIFGN